MYENQSWNTLIEHTHKQNFKIQICFPRFMLWLDFSCIICVQYSEPSDIQACVQKTWSMKPIFNIQKYFNETYTCTHNTLIEQPLLIKSMNNEGPMYSGTHLPSWYYIGANSNSLSTLCNILLKGSTICHILTSYILLKYLAMACFACFVKDSRRHTRVNHSIWIIENLLDQMIIFWLSILVLHIPTTWSDRQVP